MKQTPMFVSQTSGAWTFLAIATEECWGKGWIWVCRCAAPSRQNLDGRFFEFTCFIGKVGGSASGDNRMGGLEKKFLKTRGMVAVHVVTNFEDRNV